MLNLRQFFLVSLLFFNVIAHAEPQFETANDAVKTRQKLGQMILIGFKGTTLAEDDALVKEIMSQRVGGVIIDDQNIKNLEQAEDLIDQLQFYAKRAAIKNNNELYPLFIAIDYEGGNVARLKKSLGFPETLTAEKIGEGSFQQATFYAERMAETLDDLGINLNLAPVIDVNTNPKNPVIAKYGRSFSSDANKVIDYAAIFSKAYHKRGILCAYKHFPGHGSSLNDTHAGFADVTETWSDNELMPYKALLKKTDACDMVMTSHVVHYQLDPKGYPASVSKDMTTNLLRHQLNFEGVVITDDLQMNAIKNNYGFNEAMRLAVNAGADILMFSNQSKMNAKKSRQIVDILYKDLRSGKISKTEVEKSYQRILALKKKLRNAQ